MLIVNAELEGVLTAVRLRGDRIVAISPSLVPEDHELVIDALGGALLPGLHDHHIHLNATAAARMSVDCGPPAINSAAALTASLHQADGTGWLRGFNYHDSATGMIDRKWLDQHGPKRPIRIQHRSGRMWILNSLAIEAIGDEVPVDGRLIDQDEWLRSRLPSTALDLSAVGSELAAYGITGLTEVTPRNTLEDYHRLAGAGLAQNMRIMGGSSLDNAPPIGRAHRGEVKLHYHDHDLPAMDDLIAIIVRAHAAGRAVAAHCVTVAEILLTLAAIEEAGRIDGDRIEHAALVTPEILEHLEAAKVTVVTQPHFLAERQGAYRSEIAEADRPWLYRLAGLARRAIPIAAGSDAPFGSLNPWASMAAAVDRPEGFGDAEDLDPEAALALFTGSLAMPGTPRKLLVGEAADLCLIDRSWSAARGNLGEVRVSGTWMAGELSFISAAIRQLN